MFTEQKQLFHWRRARQHKREVAFCTRLLVGGMLILSAGTGMVQAGPTGETFNNGTIANVSRSGNTTTIDQGSSQRVDISWTSFDTTASEVVRFQQPGPSAIAINRISGARTQFDGTLTANGRIFLINQNGITFGSTAAVNVGSLVATTSNLEDNNPENLSRFAFDSSGLTTNSSIEVANGARISITSPSGFAVLVAPNVINNGIIENAPDAPMVRIELASAGEFSLDLNADIRGDGLITYAVSPEAFDGDTGVTSTGTLRARSGSIYVTANMASEIVNGVVNLDGVIDADQFVPVATGEGVFLAAAAAPGHYDGGGIHVNSVGDINVAGGTDIHAIGGDNVRAAFNANDDINMGADGSPVKITLKASDNGDNHPDEHLDVDVDLDVNAGRDGDGSIRIVGDIEVTAENTTSGLASYAGADADVRMRAANDIDISTGTRPIVVAASAVDAQGSYADADAMIDLDAGSPDYEGAGDLSVDGDIQVTATGTTASDEAQGEAEAFLYGDNVTVDGNINVAGNATVTGDRNDGSDASASADLKMIARSGDVAVTGDITVTTKTDLSSPDDESANADTHVDINGDNVDIDGNILVSADANLVGTDYAYDADAHASLDMTAEHPEGDLTVTGDIMVSAKATRAGSYDDDASADASADLIAGRNINIGNITVESLATNDRSDSDEANADSDLLLMARTGDLEVDGDIRVRSTAGVGTEGESTAEANASAELYAGRGITVRGDTSVEALATNDGYYDNAEAYAYLTAEAGRDNLGDIASETPTEGSLSMLGDITVTADGRVLSPNNRNDGDAHTRAIADLSADNDVSLQGNVRVTAYSEVDTPRPDGADALADLNIEAGEPVDNRFEMAETDGELPVATLGDITVNGDVTVSADASTNGSYASADARASMMATGDVTTTGDATVDASARATSDYEEQKYYRYHADQVRADASLIMLGGVTGISENPPDSDVGGWVNVLGEEIVRAGGDVDAVTTYLGFGEGGVDHTGDIRVGATSDLNIRGSSNTNTYQSPDHGSSRASAGVLIAGGGDVSVDTDPVTVVSDARLNRETPPATEFEDSAFQAQQEAEAPPEPDEARATSSLLIGAGLSDAAQPEAAGDLGIRGDMIARASQSATTDGVTDSGMETLASAITGLFARGDLTVRGADPLANADGEAVVQRRSSAYQSCTAGNCDPVTGGIASYDGSIQPTLSDDVPASFDQFAQLMIEAGGSVDIRPKTSPPATGGAVPLVVNVLTAYQPAGPVGPGWPGTRPLIIDNQGNLIVATGADTTRPPNIVPMDINIEEALLSGADPTELLPPTAATGCVQAGKDAYSISAPDFFDLVVSGSCETGQ